LLYHDPGCYASCRLIFLPGVRFASIHAGTAAKSYILNYMWTAGVCAPVIETLRINQGKRAEWQFVTILL